jgi:hypothetical protein
MTKGKTAMRKGYSRRGSVCKASRIERRKEQTEKAGEVRLVLDREELVAMMQDSLTDFATEMGLKVATLLLEDEVRRNCRIRLAWLDEVQLQRQDAK